MPTANARVAATSERPEPTAAERLASLRRVLNESGPDDGTISAYFKERGLDGSVPDCLRLHPQLYYGGGDEQPGRFPCMVAPVMDVSGNLVNIHRTYLAHDLPSKAAVKHPRKLSTPWIEGGTKGAAICLAPVAPVLAIAEGIETALAVMQATGLPTWSAIAATFLKELILPPEVMKAVIFGDNDAFGAGQKAATNLAARLRAEGRDAIVVLPPDEGQDWLDVYVAEGAGALTAAMAALEGECAASPDPPADLDGFPTTDLGNGERLTAHHHEHLCYEAASRRWYAFLGTHWNPDAQLAVEKYAALIARGIYDEAARAKTEDGRKALSKWAIASESRKVQMAMIDSAKHMMAVEPNHWDIDPWLFNCLNGTVDLRIGRLLPHRPEDRITKVSPVIFDPAATCPTFDRFMRQVLPEEPVRDCMQRSAGAALTALIEQYLWFLYGVGLNGKSTFTTIVQYILADYSRTAAPKLLERSRERHPTELADLHGARLVVAHETQEGRALDETRVKQLTGGDRISARFMRGDFFSFDPTHKIWMHGNHKPRITGTDYAIWRRQLLIPFPITIAEKNRDPNLLDKLKAEASGILNWMIVGCMSWQQMGITPPASVIAATESYRLEEDRIGAFITERCIVERGAKIRGGELYKAYVAWCAEADEDPVTLSAFGRSLNERGFAVARSGGKFRQGIRLEELELLDHSEHCGYIDTLERDIGRLYGQGGPSGPSGPQRRPAGGA